MSKIIKSATLLTGFAGVGLATASAEEVTVSKTTPYSSLEITRGNKEYQPNQHLPQEIPDDSTWAGRTERQYTNPEFKVLVGKKDFTVTPKTEGGKVKYRVSTVGSKDDATDESTFIVQIRNKQTTQNEALNPFGQDSEGRLHSTRSDEIPLGAGDYEFTYYYNGTRKTPAQVKLEQYDDVTGQYTTIHEETKNLAPVKETYSERVEKEPKKRIADVGGYTVQSKTEQTTPHKVKYEKDDTRELGVKEKVQDGVDKKVEVTNTQGTEQYAKGILRFNVERERKTLDEFRKDPEVKSNILGVVDLRNMNQIRLNQLANDLETLKGTYLSSEHSLKDNVRLAFYGNDNEPPLRVSFTDTMSHQQFDTLVENLRTYKGDYSPQSIIDQIFGNGGVGDIPEGLTMDSPMIDKFKKTLLTGPKTVTGVVYFSSDGEIKKEVKDFVESEGKMLYHVSYKDGYKQYWNTDKIHTFKHYGSAAERRAIMRTDINAFLYGTKPNLRFHISANNGTIEYVRYMDANGQEHQLPVDRHGNGSQDFTLPNSIEGMASVEYKINAGHNKSFFDATVTSGNRDLARQSDEIGSGNAPVPKVLEAGRDEIWKVGTKPKVVEEEINYETETELDPNKPDTYSVVKTPGKKGKKITTTTYSVDEATGNVTSSENVTTEEPVNEVIVKGAKKTKKVESPETYQPDPELEGGQTRVIQEGTPDTVDEDGNIVEKGKPRIVQVGTKPKVVETELDFNVVNKEDATKPVGFKERTQVGKKGKRITTTNYTVNEKTGEVVSTDTVVDEAPVDEINVIGTGANQVIDLPVEYREDPEFEGGKTEELQSGVPEVRDVTGKVLTEGKPRIVKVGTKPKVTKEEDIDFEVITNKDKTKPVGTTEVTQKGVKGKRTTTTTYTLNKQTGEVTTKDDVTEVKPINEIRTIGSGENKVYDIVTKYIADPLLTGSRVVEVQEGKPEIVDVNGRIVQKGEPRIVKIGTRPRVISEDIDYKVINEEDSTKAVGYKELKQKGVKGKRTVTVNYKVDTANGKITTEETTKVDEPINEIYTIGVGQNKLTELPTEYVEDPNMDGGKVEEVSKGRPEIKDPTGRIIDKGEARKVKVGTKPKVTKEEDIDFKVVNQEDKTRPVGENTVVRKGVKGKRTTTTVYTLDKTTGKVTTEDKVTVQNPVDEIHRIGTGSNISRDLPVEYIEDNTLEGGKLEEISKGRPEVKDVTGKVLDKGEARKVRVGTKSTTKDSVDLPYKVIDKEDSILTVGQTKVSVKGVKGKRITHIDYKFNKETGKFETKERVEEIKPTDEVRLVGTKPVEKQAAHAPAVEKPKAKQLPETGSRELGIFGMIGLVLAGMLGLRRRENK